MTSAVGEFFKSAAVAVARVFELLLVLLPNEVERRLRVISHVLPRDLRSFYSLMIAFWNIQNYRKKNYLIFDRFREFAESKPDNTVLIFEDEKWSFKKVDDYSNKVASVFSESLTKGDAVSIFVTNRPEYYCLVLGLAKIGVVGSLLNTNVKHKSLNHCLQTANSKVLLYSKDLESVVMDAYGLFEKNIKFYCLDDEPKIKGAFHLQHLMMDAKNFDTRQLPYKIGYHDCLLHIYTSGTTGLPKPAIVTHAKFFLLEQLSIRVVEIFDDDITYNCMPMYHVSGCLGMVLVMVRGCTVVLKKKFSASSYISDCIKYNVTIAQYIGEMCRYILKTEEKENERNHKIRMITGNGLTPDVWVKFVKRFNISNVREYYGATEGNIIRVNTKNVVGSCGYLPQIIPFSEKLFGCLLLVDDESGEPLRGPDGLCIKAPPGQPGMIVGLIPMSSDSIKKFDGYVNKVDTEKKYIRDIFQKGDKGFSSGDLLVMDEYGYLFFHERLGDTFRWKGENVSTTEVENIIKDLEGVKDCTVFAVKVTGEEGSAGMCALVLEQLDLNLLMDYLKEKLPPYAIPVFLRVVPSLEYTTTYKVIKTKLKQDAFDLQKVTDPLYIRQKQAFVPLNQDIYDLISTGNYIF